MRTGFVRLYIAIYIYIYSIYSTSLEYTYIWYGKYPKRLNNWMLMFFVCDLCA